MASLSLSLSVISSNVLFPLTVTVTPHSILDYDYDDYYYAL